MASCERKVLEGTLWTGCQMETLEVEGMLSGETRDLAEEGAGEVS